MFFVRAGDFILDKKILMPAFHTIVGDRSRSLALLVNCWAMVAIIWKSNFHFASGHQLSQWLPTIARITIAGIESNSISAIVVLVAIVNDRQRSQRFNGNHQCSDCSDLSDHMEIIAERSQQSKDRSDRVCPACNLNDPSDGMELIHQRLRQL